MFAWPYLKPKTITATLNNFIYFFSIGDWPTPKEQFNLPSKSYKINASEDSTDNQSE